jgi:apolipoprotein N-acyltransferase
MAEVALLIAVVAVPLGIGFATAYVRRPWWWGAIVAVVVFLVAAVAPEPEEGESRLVAGDLLFLLIVALVVVGLTWLGARVGRGVGRRREPRLRYD